MTCIRRWDGRYETYEESAVNADDNRALMALRNRLRYEDVSLDRMSFDYAIDFGGHIESLEVGDSGHNLMSLWS